MRFYLVSIHNGKIEYLTQLGSTALSPRHAARYTRARASDLQYELAGSTMGPFALLRIK